MTIENIYRVFMKLVIRPKDHDDYGAYKCIANNTLGETEKVVHLHRKLILLSRKLFLAVTNIEFHLDIFYFHSLACVRTDKSQSSDSRNFVLANQVDDSTEVMKSGNSFCVFLLLKKTDGWFEKRNDFSSFDSMFNGISSWCLFNFRCMGFAVLWLWMHFAAIIGISIVESRSAGIITVFCIVITAFFNTSLDFHHSTGARFL